MATTVNTDLVIYDDLAQTAFLERRQDNLEVFNASSNGAILLDNELIEGDFRKRAFYKVGGSIESRNVNSVDKVTGKKIGAGEAVSVKAPWKYGPYETTEEAFIRNKYRTGDGCDYAGTRYFDKNNNPVSDLSLDECNGTLTACKLRHGDGNELPFGGFPGTSLIRS